MIVRPVTKHSSIVACTSRKYGSGNASRTGIPSPSRGDEARASSLRAVMTWEGPRNNVIAGMKPPDEKYAPVMLSFLPLVNPCLSGPGWRHTSPGPGARTFG